MWIVFMILSFPSPIPGGGSLPEGTDLLFGRGTVQGELPFVCSHAPILRLSGLSVKGRLTTLRRGKLN
jgi:hypothetical protein